MDTLTNNPIVLGLLTALLAAVVGYVTAFFTRGKQRAELDSIRLTSEIATANQTLLAQLATTAAESRTQAALVAQQLASIALVADQTHAATNGAKTAMERVEMDLRNQVKVLEVAASQAAMTTAAALQTVRELAAVQLAAEREKVAALTQQLAQAVPPGVPLVVPAVPVTPLPVPG